jgi:hypothetical protein
MYFKLIFNFDGFVKKNLECVYKDIFMPPLKDILKTISLAVNVKANGVAWERLGGPAKRRKCVTLMINALENAGLLLPEVVHENKEVTVASPNIRKYKYAPI